MYQIWLLLFLKTVPLSQPRMQCFVFESKLWLFILAFLLVFHSALSFLKSGFLLRVAVAKLLCLMLQQLTEGDKPVVFILPSLWYFPTPNGQNSAQDDVLQLMCKFRLPNRIALATDVRIAQVKYAYCNSSSIEVLISLFRKGDHLLKHHVLNSTRVGILILATPR